VIGGPKCGFVKKPVFLVIIPFCRDGLLRPAIYFL